MGHDGLCGVVTHALALAVVAVLLLGVGFLRWRSGARARAVGALLMLAWTLWFTEAGLAAWDRLRPPPKAPWVAPTWTPRTLPKVGGHVVPRDFDAGPSDAPTIVLIGDSFAAGQGVPTDEALGPQLQRRLPGARVLTLAAPGWNLGDQLLITAALLPRMAPDVVVWVFVPNDFGAPVHQAFDLVMLRQGPKRWPLRVLDLAARADWNLVVERTTLDGYRAALAADAQDFQVGMAAIGEVAQAVTAAGGRFLFVPYPLMHRLDAYPLAEEHTRLLAVGAASGAEAVDLLPAFAGRDAETLWASVADHHPNVEAHGLAADVLAAALAQIPAAGPIACDALPLDRPLREVAAQACTSGAPADLLALAEALLAPATFRTDPPRLMMLPPPSRAADLAVLAVHRAEGLPEAQRSAVAARAVAVLDRVRGGAAR